MLTFPNHISSPDKRHNGKTLYNKKEFRHMRVVINICFFASITLTTVLMSKIVSSNNQDKGPFDWRDDWELAENLTMNIDTTGYKFPSHIMFVEQPGNQPNDPLYFVLELKGTIKVVTNDRSIHTFASDVLPIPQGPNSFDPVGLTGICLEPENGYVFVTFAYLDESQIYRNGMARYSTTPGTFGISGVDRVDLLDIFNTERSATSHQIGPCEVHKGHVYTAVGYGSEKAQAQNLHSTLGSIIRTDLDFHPPADNPFFQDDGINTAIDFVWAYGFRNIFGLKMVEGRLFATENGGDIDRFTEIFKGENYLWDGTDWGIGARAKQIFAPAVGLVDLDYISKANEVLPENYRGFFVTASSGSPGEIGRSVDGKRSILLLDYNMDNERMGQVPHPILSYRGSGMQIPVSVALGPDGLYFVPILPNQEGRVTVLRISAAPDSTYPHRLGTDASPLALINRYGCRQCHMIDGAGGSFGPALNDSLRTRLISILSESSYADRVAEVDRLENKPFVDFREARESILQASDDERATRWLSAYLQEPTFDNPKASMPNLGITRVHAEIIAEHLLASAPRSDSDFGPLHRLRFLLASYVPELRYRHLLIAFGAGGIMGIPTAIIFLRIFRRRTPTSQ